MSSCTDCYAYVATAVGQATGGGTVGCLSASNKCNNSTYCNLIVAAETTSPSVWAPNQGPISGSPSDLDGLTNTTNITNTYTSSTDSFAARICENYAVDAFGNTCISGETCYDDWFLPALDQLSCLCQNNGTLGFTLGNYWSSVWPQDNQNANYLEIATLCTDYTKVQSMTTSLAFRCVRLLS